MIEIKEWAELPVALIVLMVVAPSFIASTVRDGWIGVLICLIIAAYLLQEHIRASGGFRNAFTQPHGVSNIVFRNWCVVKVNCCINVEESTNLQC